MLASTILASIRNELNDLDAAAYRWSTATLLADLNLGRREIVRLLPERFREQRAVAATAGHRQTVPADCVALLGVIRNMGADGNTPGAAIQVVDRKTLDDYTPNWMNATAVDEPAEAVIEDVRNRFYFLNPPITASRYIEIELAASPADVAEGADIGIGDEYEQALVYWGVHRAYAAETEEFNQAKSEAARAAFLSLLGVGA